MKNRFAPKEPIALPRPAMRRRAAIRLADVLLEFLYVEHHTKLQGLLALFALPIERRVASGSSLLLEALEDAAAGRAGSASASTSPDSTRSRRCSRWGPRKATGW